MNYSLEFFKQRSFEVVWAVFRVADAVDRVDLKKVLEGKALAYLSAKDAVALDELEEVVRLGSHIGEINDINTKVLLRETGNLRTALQEIKRVSEDVASAQLHERTENTIESIFSKPPMLFSDFARLLHNVSEKSGNSPATDVQESGNVAFESGNTIFDDTHVSRASASVSGTIKDTIVPSAQHNDALSYASHMESGNDTVAAVLPHQQSPATNSPATSNRESGNISHEIYSKADQDARQLTSTERKKLIMSVIEKRAMCHINDIIAVLPGVSDRTLRYDIKTLADQRLIERIGTGGPNSFLRIKGKR